MVQQGERFLPKALYTGLWWFLFLAEYNFLYSFCPITQQDPGSAPEPYWSADLDTLDKYTPLVLFHPAYKIN